MLHKNSIITYLEPKENQKSHTKKKKKQKKWDGKLIGAENMKLNTHLSLAK